MDEPLEKAWDGGKANAFAISKVPDVSFILDRKVRILLPKAYDDRTVDIRTIYGGRNIHKEVYKHYKEKVSWNYAKRNYVSNDGIGQPERNQFLGPDAYIMGYELVKRDVLGIVILDKALGETWKGIVPKEIVLGRQ